MVEEFRYLLERELELYGGLVQLWVGMSMAAEARAQNIVAQIKRHPNIF